MLDNLVFGRDFECFSIFFSKICKTKNKTSIVNNRRSRRGLRNFTNSRNSRRSIKGSVP